MARKYPVYRVGADPTKDQPLFRVTPAKIETGIRTGAYERIDKDSARLLPAPYAPLPGAQDHLRSSMDGLVAPTVRSSGVCEICRFARFVEKAHIIPARHGGPSDPDNLLDLCPNCHTMFDRNLLKWEEMQKIWPRVCAALVRLIEDPRLDEWRTELEDRYSVSFNPS